MRQDGDALIAIGPQYVYSIRLLWNKCSGSQNQATGKNDLVNELHQ